MSKIGFSGRLEVRMSASRWMFDCGGMLLDTCINEQNRYLVQEAMQLGLARYECGYQLKVDPQGLHFCTQFSCD